MTTNWIAFLVRGDRLSGSVCSPGVDMANQFQGPSWENDPLRV
jgi:hypothetical protein